MSEKKFAQEELDALTALFNSAPHVTSLRVSWGKAEFELSKNTDGKTRVAAVTSATRNAPVVVRSQTVGTFFLAAAPGAKTSVGLGAHVQPDTAIGRIDVLHRPTPVAAGTAGRVIAILVKDGQPVEFGQPLATIDPDG